MTVKQFLAITLLGLWSYFKKSVYLHPDKNSAMGAIQLIYKE